MAAQLTLEDVSLQFAGIKVLQEVAFTAEPGQILGLVGPNGAGKTSLFNCISGHYRPSAGSIMIDGAEVEVPSCNAGQTWARPNIPASCVATARDGAGERVARGAHATSGWRCRVVSTFAAHVSFRASSA